MPGTSVIMERQEAKTTLAGAAREEAGGEDAGPNSAGHTGPERVEDSGRGQTCKLGMVEEGAEDISSGRHAFAHSREREASHRMQATLRSGQASVPGCKDVRLRFIRSRHHVGAEGTASASDGGGCLRSGGRDRLRDSQGQTVGDHRDASQLGGLARRWNWHWGVWGRSPGCDRGGRVGRGRGRRGGRGGVGAGPG